MIVCELHALLALPLLQVCGTPITRASMGDIIAGVLPYVALLILGLALVLAFPSIALWLPGTMRFQ